MVFNRTAAPISCTKQWGHRGRPVLIVPGGLREFVSRQLDSSRARRTRRITSARGLWNQPALARENARISRKFLGRRCRSPPVPQPGWEPKCADSMGVVKGSAASRKRTLPEDRVRRVGD